MLNCRNIAFTPIDPPDRSIFRVQPHQGRQSQTFHYNDFMVKTVDQCWVVYDYEVNMYMQMSALCMNGCRNHFSVPIQNALAESLLLHLRIVVDMLLSKGSDDDDLTLTDLLPEFTSQHIDKLKSAYGTRSIKDSPCWTLNKMLAHATVGRADKYDYTRILQPLTPIIASLLLEMEKARPKRADGTV